MLKIVSGGQTGADRAGLDFALEHGYPCGGWCPKGRTAEDGPLDDRYPLQETESEGYRQRTKRNIIDSDGTLILNSGDLNGGTLHTQSLATRLGKPVMVIQLEAAITNEDLNRAKEWIRSNAIGVLNVAGPRENKSPGIYHRSFQFLEQLFGD